MNGLAPHLGDQPAKGFQVDRVTAGIPGVVGANDDSALHGMCMCELVWL
jgi:hypothetical protein